MEITTTVRDMVLGLTVEELDGFFSHIDADPDLPFNGLDSHWFFRSHLFARKSTKDEERPMHHIRGRYLSAARISYILYHQFDPVRRSSLITMCGQGSCVNPLHLQVKK
jgi:hypothetical protein